LPPEINPFENLNKFKISEGVTLASDNKVIKKGADTTVSPFPRGIPSSQDLAESS
jgi:hypothetical protein